MATKAPMPIDADDLDILELVAVPCGACGQYYQVMLSELLLSQSVLHDGCTGWSDTKCQPLAYTSPAADEILFEFERDWRRIMRQVHSTGIAIGLCEPTGTH